MPRTIYGLPWPNKGRWAADSLIIIMITVVAARISHWGVVRLDAQGPLNYYCVGNNYLPIPAHELVRRESSQGWDQTIENQVNIRDAQPVHEAEWHWRLAKGLAGYGLNTFTGLLSNFNFPLLVPRSVSVQCVDLAANIRTHTNLWSVASMIYRIEGSLALETYDRPT
ncbi:hypothetical protein K474DRAFT_1678463 [Panus rudis PR-1116 ss-1]|nr:hypothetical protein K474DRAFT_1678463 [Panus rudis PR-1116 ss-1]